MGADNTYGETHFNPDKANKGIKRETNSSPLHFNEEIEAIEWVRSHTPWLIRARKNGCDRLVRSFMSEHAFDTVTKNIGQHLFKRLQGNG